MYTLEAILGRRTTLLNAAEGFSNIKLVQLPQDICMIPMVGELLQELEIRYQGGTEATNPETQQFSKSLFHPKFERLIHGVDHFARHLSRNGLIAYAEASFIGGFGGHSSLLWEHGERLESLGDNINTILKLFGVVCTHGDEFDTLGLGRYRSTRLWVQNQ